MKRIKNRFMFYFYKVKNNTSSKIRFITLLFSCLILIVGISTYFSTYSDLILEFNNDSDYTESGVSGNKVYVNDLESDYNYYMGLNYTSSNGSLPTTENKNLYNDNNLVAVKITYSGIDGSNTGYVSNTERQNTYIYFKVFVVNTNNTSSTSDDYIDIGLIDNPFDDRPNNRVFNGWQTSYRGASISYDSNYYERNAKVPVTYTDGKPNKIEITFTAKWVKGNIQLVGNNFDNAIGRLDEISMKKIPTVNYTYGDVSMAGYYHRVNIGFGSSYAGYYNNKGKLQNNGTCFTIGGCTYYQLISNENFDPDSTYYHVVSNSMTLVDNSTINRPVLSSEVDPDFVNKNMSSFYKKVHIARNASRSGYYDNTGNIQSGNCTTSGGCDYYELIQYYDNNGNQQLFDEDADYYYLVTRDTNILVINNDITGNWSDNGDYPFTVTSLNNGTLYSATWNANRAINCYNDVYIEHVEVYYGTRVTGTYDPPSNTTTYGVLYGRYNNVRVGRGITRNGTYYTFRAIVAGSNSGTGSNGSPTKYKFMVESGFYNSLSLTNGASTNSTSNIYIKNKTIYGNDYDRVKNDNAKLDVYYCASGSWSGNIYGSTNSTSSNDIALNATVKSGTFGSSKTDLTTGIYIGGRYGGTHYAPRSIKVEGGYIYNLIGGPLTASNRGSVNDTYAYMTGGSVDIIIGGAGTSATYGNRIISVTGGTVNYSVFGGSNGSDGDEGDGTLNGTPYVYIGGNATIGDEDLVENNNKLFGAEAGSVFGIGNGKTGYSTIGSCDNSVIVIDGDATINRNVYGGGNFGATGVSSSSNSSYSTIIINNGFIEGSVYGGGNNNGSGSTDKSATVNITMNDGNVVGSIYGGSNEQGTIYGNVNVNIIGGEITNCVYGGGRGGYVNNDNTGTFVRDNVNIVVGDLSSNRTPIIDGSVYGGSAFGTVNGTTNNTNVSSSSTNVTINKGIIDSVFGGGQGDSTYTPYVEGNITVTLNGGTIDNVYGGNDQSGKPNGDINVIINDGTVNEATYGGGNKTSATTTHVTLNGGTSEKIFGGSNVTGDVTNSYVVTTGGSASTVYGGNNQGGTTGITHVTINGGDIDTVYGGGEKTSVSTSTNVTINGEVNNNVFGGSNLSGNIPVSNIAINNGTIDKVFGGNNQGGTVTTSNIDMHGGIINEVYGGGLKATTTTTNVNLYYGNVNNVYGGGNEAGATTTNVNLGNLTVDNVFGGSNLSGNVTNSYIKNIPASSLTGIPSTSTHLDANNIYGGNNQGGSTHDTSVELTSGNVNNIYGGGKKASSTNTDVDIDNVTVNNNVFGGGDEATVDMVNLNITNSTIGGTDNLGNVYGGGNAADINHNVIMNIDEDTTINGNVYGGGNLGKVIGTISATINDSEVTNNVYGGGNAAAVNDNITLNISNSTIDNNVYGGGNLGVVDKKVTTTITDSIVINDIFGGGNKASVGNGTGNNAILVLDGVSANNVYGGGNAASVNGNTKVNVSDSNINTLYGGGNGTDSIVSGDSTGEDNPAKVLGNTNVTIDNGSVINDVYGGGNLGKVNGNTNVISKDVEITNSIYGGGNAAVVGGNSYLYVSGSEVSNSVYAGGNGSTAIVQGNTSLDVDNATNVGNHVFGGGNAAATGTESNNNSLGNVNIAGAIIGGNVYGGANTSVLYGTTTVNIGKYVVTNNDLIPTDISIGGTVFGGGEANASGSEEYDFSFISVTVGININIDANGYDNFTIDGSIFGSGNASSSGGYSYINLHNYGTNDDVKRNISIQRANVLTLDNSYVELKGATDRTNEYSSVLFTLSRIDELKLKNNSSIYLETGANLLKKLNSLVDVDGREVKANVNIDNENGTFSRNVNNRVYMLEGKNLNIATNENITAYGDVLGMTFFGMYALDRSNNIITALYSDFDPSEAVSSGDIYYFTNGSYVLGRHYTNHDIEVDGFYSNYGNEEGTGIEIKYIQPTPEDSNFYMWTIGETVASYDVNLTASKYSTLGTYELSLINHATANTTFSVLGVNFSGLAEDISLINYGDIPRIASNVDDANNIFGLNMKTSQSGWITRGSTNFVSNSSSPINGTIDYKRENSGIVPSLVFYLYHSKNLTATKDLGTVTISLVAITPIDDLTNDVERININVNLNTALYNTNDYEATITPGKQYEMFANSPVNITTKSSFSSYYSLFMSSDTNPYRTGYHRSLVSTYLFPVNTEITMIDFHSEDTPVYYYYVVNSSDYSAFQTEFNNYGEVSYDLSKFVRMGSTSSDNHYDDSVANSLYYNNGMATEEFIFMVDFKDTIITSDALDKSLLIELRNDDNQTLISVLGIEQATMKYNLYSNSDAVIDVNSSVSVNPVYIGDSTMLTVDTNFTEQSISGVTIDDTNYDDDKLGIKISIFDSNNNLLSSSSLMGVNFEYNNNTYYPRYDGTVRINIAETTSNVRTKIKINTANSQLSKGDYKILVESFGSPDGIYYGLVSSDQDEVDLYIIDTPYGLSANIDSAMRIIDKKTGFTQNGNNNFVFNLDYLSNLDNPNIRIKLYRRNYDSIYSSVYDEVNLRDYITNEFVSPGNMEYYLANSSPGSNTNYFLYFKDDLLSGTYKFDIMLYDGNNYIGDINEYFIIK